MIVQRTCNRKKVRPNKGKKFLRWGVSGNLPSLGFFGAPSFLIWRLFTIQIYLICWTERPYSHDQSFWCSRTMRMPKWTISAVFGAILVLEFWICTVNLYRLKLLSLGFIINSVTGRLDHLRVWYCNYIAAEMMNGQNRMYAGIFKM